jgi:hypothetical protein
MEWVFDISGAVKPVLEEHGIDDDELAHKIGDAVRGEILSFINEKLNDVINA